MFPLHSALQFSENIQIYYPIDFHNKQVRYYLFTGEITNSQKLNNLLNAMFYKLRQEREERLINIFQITGHMEKVHFKFFVLFLKFVLIFFFFCIPEPPKNIYRLEQYR